MQYHALRTIASDTFCPSSLWVVLCSTVSETFCPSLLVHTEVTAWQHGYGNRMTTTSVSLFSAVYRGITLLNYMLNRQRIYHSSGVSLASKTTCLTGFKTACTHCHAPSLSVLFHSISVSGFFDMPK